MNKTLTSWKDKFKIMKIESKQIFSPANLIFVLVILIFAWLQIAFIKNIHDQEFNAAKKMFLKANPGSLPKNWLDWPMPGSKPPETYGHWIDVQVNAQTFSGVVRIVSAVVLYSIINRIRLVLTDNSTIDKNRAAYMNFKKTDVLLAKVVSDLLLFAFPIILAAFIGPIYVIHFKGGDFTDTAWMSKLTITVIGVIVAYLLATMGMRISWYSTWPKKVKISILIAWLSAVIGWLVISSIVFGVLRDDTYDWIVDNKYLVAFLPFLNVGTPWLIFYDTLPMWTIIPMIVYTFAFVIGVWKLTSKWAKLRLTIQN